LTVAELTSANAEAASLEAPVKLMVAVPPVTLRLVMWGREVPDLTIR
jgi:hypothetical protein